MKLKNIMIAVNDVEKSKQFYHDVFGLDVLLDNGDNVILTEGLVLQDRKTWESFLGKEAVLTNHACELYFEERDLERFAEKLELLYPSVSNGSKLTVYDWGKRVLRFYDPDGHLIEVGTPNR